MSSRSRMRERDLLLFVFGVATHFTIQYGTVNGRRVAYRHGHCEKCAPEYAQDRKLPFPNPRSQPLSPGPWSR